MSRRKDGPMLLRGHQGRDGEIPIEHMGLVGHLDKSNWNGVEAPLEKTEESGEGCSMR